MYSAIYIGISRFARLLTVTLTALSSFTRRWKVSLEKQVTAILKSSETIKKASNDIDTACEKINSSYIKKIVDKIDKFELKLNKAIIKKMN